MTKALANARRVDKMGIDLLHNFGSHIYYSHSTEQQWKSMAGQRTRYLIAHKFLYNASDDDIINYHKGYKIAYTYSKKLDDNSIFIDLSLLKDMIDYQLVLRELNNNELVPQILSEIAKSYYLNVKLSEQFITITSEALIDQLINFKHYAENIIKPLFYNSL